MGSPECKGLDSIGQPCYNILAKFEEEDPWGFTHISDWPGLCAGITLDKIGKSNSFYNFIV